MNDDDESVVTGACSARNPAAIPRHCLAVAVRCRCTLRRETSLLRLLEEDVGIWEDNQSRHHSDISWSWTV